MGREVRLINDYWIHPKNSKGSFIPLFDGVGFYNDLAVWNKGSKLWEKGFREDFLTNGIKLRENDELNMPYSEWAGDRPCKDDYMPTWYREEINSIIMYETCTEGTPISVPFNFKDGTDGNNINLAMKRLAMWLWQNKVSAFANMTADYDQWLNTIKNGSSVSMIMHGNNLYSGVEAGI